MFDGTQYVEFADPLARPEFWESIAVPAQPDIDGIAAWGDRALGAGSTGGERFVLLLRSELLRRYPDAVIYATRPGPPVEEQHPIFIGRVAPDITYLGFGIGVDEIAAYSIVIQEHPSAPRFGIEVTADPGTASHLAPTGSNAAVAARATRQMPVRVTIPYPVLQRQS